MAQKPAAWGVPLTQRDYVLYMEGSGGPTDAPQSLEGHGLTSPNQELSDPVTYVDMVRRGGRMVAKTVTARGARVNSVSYTMTFPIKAQWTPAMAAAMKSGSCTKDFYLIPDCISEHQYKHWKILSQATVNPPVPAEDMISITTDEGMVSYTADVSASEEVWGWEVGAFKTYTISGTKKANATAFFTEDCEDCDILSGQALVVTGGDGTAVPTTLVTENRWGSNTAVTFGALTDTGKSVYATGDTVVISTFSGATYAAATAGKLFVSTNRLASAPVQVTGLIDVISKIVGDGRLVFAVGKQSDGDAALHYSQNGGQSWTASTSSALPTGSAALSAAWDRDTQRLYVACEDGKLLLGTFTGSSLTLTDISSNLPGSPGDLTVVVALGKKTLFVGGAAGYAAESINNGATWESRGVSGTTAITSADGNLNRLLVGAGSTVYIRDVLRENNFKAMTIEDGLSLSGTITDIKMGPNDDFNLFSIATTAGELVIVKDFRPV